MPENILNSTETEQLLISCYKSTAVFCRTIFGEAFSIPFSPLHMKIIEKLDGDSTKVLILAPRGIGKTTLVKHYIMKEILFREARFILYISKSLQHAQAQTESIKRDLLANRTIRDLFGSVKETDLEYVKDFDESFSKQTWVAFGHTIVVPKGSNQQVRGSLWGVHRPDLVIMDDLEDVDQLNNETIRDSRLSWYTSDVEYCGKIDDSTRFIYIDTLKHFDALPVHLQNRGDYDCTTLQICDPTTFKSNAPLFHSDEWVQRELEKHRKGGTLTSFYKDQLNIPIAVEEASFRPEHFKYFEESEMDPGYLNSLANFVIIDPANKVEVQCDDTAIAGVAVDLDKGAWYVRDMVSGKFYPDQAYDEMIKMAWRINACAVGIETNGKGEYILHPFKNELARRGIFNVSVIDITATRDKEERIKSLIAPYRRGLIFHNRSCCHKLESQLLSFPFGQRDDEADALAHITYVLAKGGAYMITGETVQEQDFRSISYDEPLETIGATF